MTNKSNNNVQENSGKNKTPNNILSLAEMQQLLMFQEQQIKNDEINFIELFGVLKKNKLFILIFSISFALASTMFAVYKPNVYSASILLSPTSGTENNSGIASLAGQFGGLAGMAGISLGQGSADKTDVALEIIRSRIFIKHFIDKYQILIPLMAGKEWDPHSEVLILDANIYDEKKGSWIINEKTNKEDVPTLWEAYRKFSKLLSISQDKTTSMITIKMEFVSPILVQRWLTWLVSDINEYVREKEKLEAQTSIDYLTEKLEKIQNNNMEKVFYQLIEEQTKNMMLIEVKPEYVFDTIDPAEVPDKKAKPQRALIILIGTVLGLMLSIIFVLTKYFVKKVSKTL